MIEEKPLFDSDKIGELIKEAKPISNNKKLIGTTLLEVMQMPRHQRRAIGKQNGVKIKGIK